MPKKFLKTELKKSAFSDQCSVLCAACVASVGEQPEPGEEKIIRSQRHYHKITERHFYFCRRIEEQWT